MGLCLQSFTSTVLILCAWYQIPTNFTDYFTDKYSRKYINIKYSKIAYKIIFSAYYTVQFRQIAMSNNISIALVHVQLWLAILLTWEWDLGTTWNEESWRWSEPTCHCLFDFQLTDLQPGKTDSQTCNLQLQTPIYDSLVHYHSKLSDLKSNAFWGMN